MPDYRILTLKPFFQTSPLSRYIPLTQFTAFVFTAHFLPKSELAPVLWSLYCRPWVKECFLDLSLRYTFAFPSPLLDGPQSKDSIIWFLTYLLPTTGDFCGLCGCCCEENKECQTSIPAEALVTSMAMGCTPMSNLLTKGIKWKKVNKSLSTAVFIAIKMIHSCFYQRWTLSLKKKQWKTYKASHVVWLLMVSVIFISKMVLRGALTGKE